MTKTQILNFLQSNNKKYVVDISTNEYNVYHLLNDGTWKSSSQYGYCGSEPDIDLILQSKVFDSIKELKSYLKTIDLPIEIEDDDDINVHYIPYSKVKQTCKENDLTVEVWMNPIPSPKKLEDVESSSVDELKEQIFDLMMENQCITSKSFTF